jgi:hypothetical protein
MMLIPKAALESHIAILGKTGSGKSNAAKTIAEKLMADGERVCVIDPTGTWWGLRLTPDGKKSKYEPTIFGGEHGDLPLSELHGPVLGEAIATSSDSAIIDTRSLTVGQRSRFFTAFAEALLRFNRGPLHVIVDEAHIFMPQGRTDPEGGKMVHAGNNMVSLGRGVGLRVILISQRPQKLHKDSLTQTETLVAMRVMHPLDRKAYEVWIQEQGDNAVTGKEIVDSLASLPTGDAWVWSPLANYLKRVHFPLAHTFDSGKPLSRDQAAPELAPLDTAALGAKMDALRQEAQANDPKRLKARIAELEREKAKPAAPVDTALFEQMNYKKGFEEGARAGADAERQRLGQKVLDFAGQFALATGEPVSVVTPPARTIEPKVRMVGNGVAKVANAGKPVQKVAQASDMGGERKPLAILARVYPGGYTEAQWATLAGFKRTGGTWGTYKSRLRSTGRIEQRGDLWHATEQGASEAGDVDAMPNAGPELVAWWAQRIGSERKILEHLSGLYPHAIDKADLADALAMTASGGTFGTYLSRLRSNGLIEETGNGFRVSPNLMEYHA